MKRLAYLSFSAFLMVGVAACESTHTKQSAAE